MNLLRKYKGFTLIEVMVCIVLTCIVVFFVYTMMLTSHRTYAKLFSISKQKNDIRYFETLLKNSIMNAEYMEQSTSGSKAIFKFRYYDSKNSSNVNIHRLDVFEFSNNNLVKRNKSKSMSLLSETEMNSYTSASCNVKFYSQLCYANNPNTSISSLVSEHMVIDGINVLFWDMSQYDDVSSETYEHHTCFTISLVLSKTLSDGEVNTENRLYRLSMRNFRCKV